MSIDRAASIDDLRRLAQRRLPHFAFDFLDGGAEDETNLSRNVDAFDAHRLVPRYLVDISERSSEAQLFGRSYAQPFGSAPIGLLNLFSPGADMALARLAARERIRHVLSTAASTTLEQIAEAAEGYAWFQLYISGKAGVTDQLLDRAEAAGYDVVLVTVDTPVPGKRDRDVRNGFQVPFRMTPRVLADLCLHPRWSLATLAAGTPSFANLVPYTDKAGAQTLMAFQEILSSGAFDWDDLKRMRDRWQGRLLLKGVLHPEDAVRCVDLGCDGLVVSNHGGRQVSFGPASIDALPAIAKAVDGAVPILLDSGIRRGADIIRAKALGADFALLGRGFGYGLAAAGAAGAQRAFEIIRQELSYALGQLGQPTFAAIDHGVLAGPAEATVPPDCPVRPNYEDAP